MSDLFFEIMQLQPNENEFFDAVRDRNSKETAYKMGFMHGRSYAAQMADEYAYRNAKKYERLVAQLAEAKEFMEVELTGTAWADCRHMAHSISTLLAQLQAEKGGEL